MSGIPAFEAIYKRAMDYRCDVITRTGVPPVRFLVTEDEWRWLAAGDRDGRFRDAPLERPQEMTLMGMQVHRPTRIAWARDGLVMEHFIYPATPAAVWDVMPIAHHPISALPDDASLAADTRIALSVW
jgi:hypothetical protein